VGFAAGGIFIVALAVGVALRVTADGLGRGDHIASIASMFIGVASLAVGVVSVIQATRRSQPTQSDPSVEMQMAQHLQGLLRRAGNLTTRGLQEELRRQKPGLSRAGRGLGAVLRGKQRPTWDLTAAIIASCIARAERLEIALPPEDHDMQRWRSLYDELFTDAQPGRRPRAVVGVAVLVAVVVAPVAVVTLVRGGGEPDPGPAVSARASGPPSSAGVDVAPFTTSAVEVPDICRGGWLVAEPVADVPPLPRGSREEWVEWASEAEALTAPLTRVQFAVRGRSEAAVVLTEVRIRVLQRETPPGGAWAHSDCGGENVFRWLSVDLDTDPPRVGTDYRPEFADPNGPPERREPIRFPYQVSLDDPESFEVFASAHQCDCRWQIELLWNSGEHSGVHTVEVDGAPGQFRTVGLVNAETECVGAFNNCNRITN
jgi:hypothetical protein